MRIQLFRVLVASVVLVLVGNGTVAWAQRTTATFAGIVTDGSGGVLPGADVELANEQTGTVERQVTSVTGEFLFNYVPVGSYTVTISIQGFKTFKATGMTFSAAQNVRGKFKLEVGDLKENVTVTGTAPLLNSVSPEQRINLEPLEVKALPSVNRNISNLLTIGTGISRQEGPAGTTAVANRLRMNGLGGGSMSITANGTDASGNAGSRQLSQYNAISKIDVMSIEAIGEVQIVKGIVPAEYSHALAGNVNLITKAGSNDWHGSLFYRYEGDALSAKPALLAVEPASEWQQYGGSLGGPVARDRAFFFVAYEAYKQDTSSVLNANVPTPLLRSAMLTALPFVETQMYLDRMPLPNQPVTPAALTGVFIGPGSRTASDQHIDARTDFRVAGGNVSAVFTTGRPALDQAIGMPTTRRTATSRSRRMSVSYAGVRGRWSAETRFGYNYNWLSRIDSYTTAVDPTTPSTVNGYRSIPSIAFPGLTQPSGDALIHGRIPSYTFEQQVALVAGKHSFKFGGIYTHPTGGRDTWGTPSVQYQSLNELLVNRPSQVNFLSSSQAVWRTTNFGFFAQDDWRISSRLVLNLGVRYDWFGHFLAQGAFDKNSAGFFNLDGVADPSFTFGPPRDRNNPFESDAGINLGPRMGFAYTWDEQGKTVMRGGWGMMFQPLDPQSFEGGIAPSLIVPRRRSFSALEASALGLKWPVYNEDMLRIMESRARPELTILVDPHIQVPYATVFTIGIQRALTSSTVLEATFVGTRGSKFPLGRTYNQVDRLTGVRPNPSLGQDIYYDNSQKTDYRSLQTGFRQRLTHGLMTSINYTWSRNDAYTGGDVSAVFVGDTTDSVQDFFNVEAEHGPATGDVRHSLVASWVYQLPTGRFASSPLAKHLIDGWEIAGIITGSSGLPLNITQSSVLIGSRPDVVNSANAINPDCCGVGNMQYLNRAAFQAVPLSPVSRATVRAGNAGYNAFRGPGFWNLDLSLMKAVSLGSQRRLELRADFVNAFNTTRYMTFQTNINAVNFGAVTGTGNPRTIQVQARIAF